MPWRGRERVAAAANEALARVRPNRARLGSHSPSQFGGWDDAVFDLAAQDGADEARMMRERLAEMTRELRAFARSLCRDPIMADDLVQEALLRAWSKRDSFQPGTNFRAWMFTILRNLYFSHLRRSRREIQDADGEHAAQIPIKPSQPAALEMEDFRRALHLLPAEQREALILIGAGNLSYGEVAKISGCAVGTVKSRVARARTRLVELLSGEKQLPTLAEAAASTAELANVLAHPKSAKHRATQKKSRKQGR